VFIADASDFDENDKQLLESIKDKNYLFVINKTDKSDFKHDKAHIYISAKDKVNITQLRQAIYDKTALGGLDLSGDFLCEERHFDALNRAKESLISALSAIENVSLDILAIDVKDAWDALGEISGKTATEEIINNIFSKFCVGK
jgi:tRNA modification GTPase